MVRLGWIARGLGTLAGAWWLLSGVAHLIWGREPPTLEGALLGVLIVANVTGVALAWWRGRLGGVILALAGAALCVFAYLTAGHNKGLAVLVSGAPFLLVGILLLVSSKRANVSGSWRSPGVPPAREPAGLWIDSKERSAPVGRIQ